MHLRCAQCEHTREVTVSNAEAERYDEALDSRADPIARAVRKLDLERMAATVESLIVALQRDLIGPRTSRASQRVSPTRFCHARPGGREAEGVGMRRSVVFSAALVALALGPVGGVASAAVTSPCPGDQGDPTTTGWALSTTTFDNSYTRHAYVGNGYLSQRVPATGTGYVETTRKRAGRCTRRPMTAPSSPATTAPIRSRGNPPMRRSRRSRRGRR